MRRVQHNERAATVKPAPSSSATPSSQGRVSTGGRSNGSAPLNGTTHAGAEGSSGAPGQKTVGVLPLVEGALDVGDDGRAVVWLDIDNTLYSKATDIARLMTVRIRAYIIGLGLSDKEAEQLHSRYYTEYGLAIRGLVMHHKIDALDYDAKCDATLPLEDVLRPDKAVQAMLGDLDRTKCRVWALTNAYKTHAMRVLKLLELDQYIEGVIYCDYSQERFACKPEREFYDAALDVVGLRDPSRCFFVDDSALNIRAARGLGWGNCVLFSEEGQREQGSHKKREESSSFDSAVLVPASHATAKSAFDREKVQQEFRRLPQQQRIELLHIILDACLPGDIVSMTKTLEKHLRLTKDMISSLPGAVCQRIFEKLEVKELLTCQRVSKKWNAVAANPALWKSHALGLTDGDSVPLLPPAEPSGWEPLVRALYFRERNWARGICQTLTLMPGHTGFVTAMKLKGRRTLVTGSYDETIRVWDLYTGACKKVLTAKAIACLDFLDEEAILAAGLYDSGRVMVWDMKTWTLLQTLGGHNRGIRNVAISPDYLVSVGQDKAIVVWDWRSGTKVVRFGQQSNVSLGVSIVDRDKIVAVTVDGVIRTFCIRRKEMIGQFDVAKLSPALATQLAGLKAGTLMMQWFAAHRNTITLASQNLVIHLQWQEHVVPVQTEGAWGSSNSSALTGTPPRLRPRADSTASNVSTASNMTARSSGGAKAKATTTAGATLTPSHTSSHNLNRTTTPARFQSPSAVGSQRGSPSPASPTPWPRATSGGKRQSLTTSPSVPSLAPLSPTRGGREEATRPVQPAASSTATRIAPNLTVAPVIVDVLQTPDGATGCVDPAKKRIVLASRFSSRAGADRRIYTSTLDGAGSGKQSNGHEDVEASRDSSERQVVAVGGAWQARADELSTPARNPMSLVLDHENCVLGTSEGLVYRMGFVGSEYSTGWVEDKSKEQEEGKVIQPAQEESLPAADGTITSLLQLRTVWKQLFV